MYSVLFYCIRYFSVVFGTYTDLLQCFRYISVVFGTATVMFSVVFCCFLCSYCNFSSIFLFLVQLLTYCNVFGNFLLFPVQIL